MNEVNGGMAARPSIEELQCIALQVRRDIIEMIYTAQAGHPGGSLSAADIVTALYFRVMRIDPINPQWPDRDRFILSKGHACPVWYSALCNRGYFDRSHLSTLRKLDSILQGHADMKKTPGVDMTVGSLGQGICAGLGMALGARLVGKDFHVWVMVGDGELQEGSVWEAAMAGAKWRLDNLTVIVDNNHLQNDAATADTMPVAPIGDKWRAFGWNVVEIDGHDMGQIVTALEAARDASVHSAGFSMTGQDSSVTLSGSTVQDAPRQDASEGSRYATRDASAQTTGLSMTGQGTLVTLTQRPTVIIAETVKGKGVSFMENRAEWHGKAPNAEQTAIALAEIGGAA